MTCYHVIATYLPSVVFINRLDLDRADLSRSVKDLPPSLTVLLECHKPPSKPPNPLHPAFGLFSEEEIPKTLSLDDYTWMLARSLTHKPNHSDVPESQECEVRQSAVPVWSAYNSLVNNTMHVTRVGAPPLIAALAHEWNTLLTVLKQAQAINVKVVGANRKTVISLDVGLYLPAKKLQMLQLYVLPARAPALRSKHIDFYCKGSAMVAFPKEAGSIGETTTNASCTTRNHNASSLSSNGLEQ